MASKPPGSALGAMPWSQNVRDAPRTTLWSILRNGHRELKSIDAQRATLQHEIESLRDAISKAQSDYWAEESRAFHEFFDKGGENNFTKWRHRFARKESRKAMEVESAQRDMRSQIARHEEELTQLDAQYWAKWNACLEAMQGPLPKKTPRREAKSASPPGPSGIRKMVSKASASSSRQPAAPKASLKKALGQLVIPSPSSAKVVGPSNRKETHITRPAQGVQGPTASVASLPGGITNAVPGQVYQGFYSHDLDSEKGWYMGTPLPWNGKDWEINVRLEFTMSQMDPEPFPECYIPEITHVEKQDEQGNTVTAPVITGIKGWAPGFEDGGPREKDRCFLFLFFEDRNKRPGKLNIPKRATSTIKFSKVDLASLPIDWVAAKHLRPAAVNDRTMVRGRVTAAKFKRLMGKVKVASVPRDLAGATKEDLESDAEGDITGSYVDTTGISANASSANILQSTTHETSQKDQEMTQSAPDHTSAHDEPRDVLQSPGKYYSFSQSPNGKMDVDEGCYEEKPATKQEQIATAGKDDPDKFDEGLGMDYDLDFGKPVSALSPTRGAPRGGEYQDIATKRLASEPLSPVVALTPRTQRFPSVDSAWQSQDGQPASGHFPEHQT